MLSTCSPEFLHQNYPCVWESADPRTTPTQIYQIGGSGDSTCSRGESWWRQTHLSVKFRFFLRGWRRVLEQPLLPETTGKGWLSLKCMAGGVHEPRFPHL